MLAGNNKYEIDMCSGPIFRKLLRFALPLMASTVLQLLFNAADIVVVGRFAGDNSLAAVGSTSSLVALFTNLFLGLSVGANVIVARYYGANDKKSLSETIHTSMLISLISGIVLTVLGELLARVMLELMKADKDVIDLAAVYLRVYFIGMTATMVYNFASAILRAAGDTKRPLYYLFVAGIVNVILNLFFVIVLNMDVAGVALATTISQCISAALVVRCLIKGSGMIHFEPKKMRIYKDKLIEIIRVGLPAGIQGTVFSISNVVIQSSVNSFGAVVIAGNSAGNNIEHFMYAAINAFAQGAVSFTSQNYGAGEKKRINKILVTALGCVIVTGTVLGVLTIIFSKPLVSIYTSNPEVIKAGRDRLAITMALYATCGMMDVMAGTNRGLGYSIVPMAISMIGACGIRLLWIWTLFAQPQFHTQEMLFMIYPVSWVATFLAHLVCFFIIKPKADKKMDERKKMLQN